MPERASILVALPVGLLLAACGEEPPPWQQGTTPPSTAAPSAAEFRIPPPTFIADPRRGEALFRSHCMTCHGDGALGTERGPPLIHRIYEPSHHSDLAFYRAAALGVHQHHWDFGHMPPVADVDGEAAAHIIAWVRGEQRRAGIQ